MARTPKSVNGVMTSAIKTRTFVYCSFCNEAHDMNSDTYVTILGDVYIGVSNRLTKNIDANGIVKSAIVMCKSHGFVAGLVNEIEVHLDASSDSNVSGPDLE